MPITADEIIQRSKQLRKPGKVTSDEFYYIVTSPALLNPHKNPCIVEQYYVKKCMYEQNYDALKCEDYFQNHKACGRFWARVKRHRLMKGETPILPLPEEREKIKQQYMEDVRNIMAQNKFK